MPGRRSHAGGGGHVDRYPSYCNLQVQPGVRPLFPILRPERQRDHDIAADSAGSRRIAEDRQREVDIL